jgi:hypothetical protein
MLRTIGLSAGVMVLAVAALLSGCYYRGRPPEYGHRGPYPGYGHRGHYDDHHDDRRYDRRY